MIQNTINPCVRYKESNKIILSYIVARQLNLTSSKLVVNCFSMIHKPKKYQGILNSNLCTAVADEKYFNHVCISPYMLVFLDFTGFPAFSHFRETCVFWHMSAGFPLKSCKIGCKTPPILQLYNSPNYISFHLFLNVFKAYMRISVQRHANIRVPHNLLQRLRVHARLCHIGAKCMTADMRCHLWHIIFVQIQKAHFPVYHGFVISNVIDFENMA